ncbi:hypothetical protein PMAYCL1PPCAC_21497, partial [Pristionchus mayeri]
MFGGIVSERVYHAYSYSTTICSLVANSLLIFVIFFTTLKNIGAYRWLLFCFAIMDILISLVHSFMCPASHMTEFGYVFWGYRFLEMPTEYGSYGSLLWCFIFYQSFILLAFHYVYRYVILCKYFDSLIVKSRQLLYFSPLWLSFMSRNTWRNWISLAVAADLIYTGFSC